MAKIYIDPGHGNTDPGAVGKRSKEKDNVLKVGKRLATLLKNSGHTVKLSRSTDVFISLSGRTNDANKWGADIFVSLHNNAASSSASGFETFVYNGGVGAKTKRLQSDIHQAIISKICINDRGKKQANFAVLRLSTMPAVLIEYGFITNKGDEDILINQVNNLAKWTADGINSFFGTKTSQTSKPAKKPVKKDNKGYVWLGTKYKGRRVESIYRGKDGLNFYNGPRWTRPSGTFGYGQGWKVDNKYLVNGSPMYRVQNSKGDLYWITASPKYVTIKGKY